MRRSRGTAPNAGRVRRLDPRAVGARAAARPGITPPSRGATRFECMAPSADHINTMRMGATWRVPADVASQRGVGLATPAAARGMAALLDERVGTTGRWPQSEEDSRLDRCRGARDRLADAGIHAMNGPLARKNTSRICVRAAARPPRCRSTMGRRARGGARRSGRGSVHGDGTTIGERPHPRLSTGLRAIVPMYTRLRAAYNSAWCRVATRP